MGNRIEPGNIFVSLNGNDSWTGSVPDPSGNGYDGPFATIERALASARKLLRKHKCVQIWLRNGVYRLERTLKITNKDLGAKGTQNKLIISAFPEERPVLSGGRRIENLKETQFNGTRCWVAEIPDVKDGKWQFSQLFANGARRSRPRLPREGFYRFTGLPEGLPQGATRFRQGPDRALFRDNDIQQWKNLADVELVAYQLWFDTHHRIRSVDIEKQIVVFQNKSIGNLRDDANNMARYHVENVFEALELPGEWYLDRTSGLLYYLPFPDEKLETTTLIAPSLDTLLLLKGSSGNPVRNVVFENISFEHAEWIHPKDFVGSTQSGVDVPGAVILENAENCVLYGCSIFKISQYGVELRQGCSGNKIVACTITDMGAGGVKVGHEWIARKAEIGDKTIRKSSRVKPSRTSITDCDIGNGSWKYPGAIGIWVGNAGENLILHNHIHDLNYTGISLGWTWGYAPTATVGDLVEGNHVHHINMNQQLADNGGIYTLGQRPGCMMRRNLIHHIGCHGYGGFGIYHDEGTSEQIVEYNIVHHTQDAAFFTHYGRDNLLRNNIFALSGGVLHINPGAREEPHRTTVFERNIVFWNGGGIGQGRSMGKWSLERFLFQDNLFWGGSPDIEFGNGVTLDDWKSLGQFKNTVVDDPLMSSPDSGNFSLSQESPALKTGFIPFSLDDVGPRMTNDSKPSSFEKWKEPLETPKKIVRASISFSDSKAIVTLKNIGYAKTSGVFRISAAPTDTVEITGNALLCFNLRPGESTKKSFRIKTLKSGRFHVSATPVRSKFLVASFSVGGAEEKKFQIPILKSKTGHLLKEMPMNNLSTPMRFEIAGKDFGTIRMAVCDGTLIAVAELFDNKFIRGDLPWEGSCLELFFSPSSVSGSEIAQLFAVPKKDGGCELLRQSNGTQIPQAGSFCDMERTTKGWRIAVSLPLKDVGIDYSKGVFHFEAALNGHYGEKDILGRVPLWGAASPPSSVNGYAEINFCAENL